MTTTEQYQCPVCMLSSNPDTFVNRTLLDPADFGKIVVRDCRGKKGLPVIERIAFINKKEEYPEVYERLKDVCLGLINAFYNHDLIKPTDLIFMNKVLDSKEEKIIELTEKVGELKDIDVEKSDELKAKYKEKFNRVLDLKDERIMELKDKVNRIIKKYNNLSDIRVEERENIKAQYEEHYEEEIESLKQKIYQLQSALEDYQVEAE